MTELWTYRLLGEEFGPAPTATLRDLLKTGDLVLSDEVAPVGGAWGCIRDFPELTAAEPEPEEPALDADLAGLLEQVADTSANSGSWTGSPIQVDTLWSARVLGAELGPFEWEHLLQMVAQGELSESDEVRHGAKGRWQRAGEIVGLFTESDPEADETTADDRAAEDVWFQEVAGRPSSPLTMQNLKALIAVGRLTPRDRIREGRNGPWVRAATLPGLFTEQERARTWAGQAELAEAEAEAEANTAETLEIAAGTDTAVPVDQPPAPAPEPAEPQDRWSQFFEQVEARERKKYRRDTRPVESAPAAPTPPPASVTPAAAPVAVTKPAQPVFTPPPPPTVSAPVQASPPPAPPAFVAPKRPKQPMKLPSINLSGLFSVFQGSGGGGGGNTRILVPVVLVAVAIAGLKFAPISFGGTPGAKDYTVLTDLWQRAQQIKDKEGSATEWSALVAEAKPVIDEMQARLAPIVSKRGRDVPLAQHILWMVDTSSGPTKADGYFRKILSAGANGSRTDFTNAGDIMDHMQVLNKSGS